MNMLETYILSILNEDESLGTPTLDDVGMILSERGGVRIIFVDTRKPPHRYSKEVVGMIFVAERSDKCHKGYEVKNSYSRVKGFGKYLYRMAGQYAHSKGGLLFSDRTSVSSDAAGVWSYIYKNTDKEDRKPFDDEQNPKTPPKEDDCEINRSGRNTLNYAYDVNLPGDKELYEKMLARGDEWVKNHGNTDEDFVHDIALRTDVQFMFTYNAMDPKTKARYKLS